jgi:hypothetical protein
MSARSLLDYRLFKGEGERIGREGMSRRVAEAIDHFESNGATMKGAMILAGRLKAIAMMSAADDYWREQVEKGLEIERGASRKRRPENTLSTAAIPARGK